MYNTKSRIITITLIVLSVLSILTYFLLPEVKRRLEIKKTEEIISEMTIEQKVGQLFIMGFWGTEPDYYITKMITERNIGGVILLGYNIKDTQQVNKLTTDLQALSAVTPLFISIDQEGGEVSRLGTDIVSEITAQKDITNEKDAYKIARNRGTQLRELGINMNFSPVLDNITDETSFMYERVFRNDISSLGANMIEGYMDAKIISVPKHFPGHSNDSTDSHNSLPVVNIVMDELDNYISQFKYVIEEEKPKAIMVGHIQFPNISEAIPSSLSSIFIQDILRDRLGFEGIVITDDMQMKSVSNTYSIQDSAIMAIQAGCDILIYTGEPEQQAEAYNSILGAVKDGIISEERIDESLGRILGIKKTLFNF
ncbi:MAG: glycoside hydrolase family 3 N-terminal domain-containing protein [Candidatus Dojkabacteria bacterium]|nr:glycoside hydrolase family 3 N-terminal domain-containing protein [Candidatus Dojkabacteria bacterium]